MAFDELPQIDRFSKNADTSEIKFRGYFNQYNNFISRTDVPDKGCDFDVELIIKGASNWRFPTQLKSIENLKLISGDEFISYSFETSRLGYLLRRHICGGLIVLYSLEEDKLFYEYADKVYSRLLEERENENWKKNESVNIRIPYSNVLDEISLKNIYETFKRRFEQGRKMQITHGINYGLPTINDGDFVYDFTNKDHLKKFLKESGFLFLYNHDFNIVFRALTELPSKEIISDKELLILSAVVYSEAAQYSESELFIAKLKKKFNVEDEEVAIINFQSLKNKLMLGYISNSQFIEQLNNIKLEDTDTSNLITVRTNILRYKLIEHNNFSELPDEFKSECQKIFNLIEHCNCTERIKNLFKIWNCELESIIINDELRLRFNAVKLREALRASVPDDEKKENILSFLSSQSALITRLNEIFKWAISKNDKLIEANALSAYVTHFIQKEILFLSWDVNFSQKISFEYVHDLKRNYGFALNAFNCFIELNMLKEAHYNLCNAIEILFEAEMLFKEDLFNDKNYLLSVKQSLEAECDFEVYNFQFPKLINKAKENEIKKEDSNMEFTKDMSDDMILFLAKTSLSSFSLPEERLENIINEIKSYRLFFQRCQNNNIEVIQASDFPIQEKDYYKEPIKFVLRSKSTGIETAKSSDMDMLLTSWGL